MPTDNLNTASAISPEKLDSTEDQSPEPWAVPMAKPAGGFQPEATPLTFEPRPREVNKILNSKHVTEGMDLTDPDEAAVFVANFLSSKHNADKNEIYNDYELNTQVYGLSGTDSVADAKAILDGDTRTHQKSENRIAKKPKEEVGSLAYAASQPVVVFEGMGKGGLSMAGGLFSQAADYSRKAGVALETTPEEKEQILQLQKDWIELSKPEREQAKLAGVSGTVRGGGKREIRPFEIASPMGTRKDSTLGKEEFQRQDDRKALQARADAIQSGIISRHEKTFLGEFSGEASAASDWLRDARETYGEYDLIPAGAREGLVGEFSNVLGTSMPIMASMMASGGAGLFLSQSQMYENMRDSERAFAESQGEEFDPTKDLFSRGGAATAMAMIERLMGVEKMLSTALKTTGKKSVTNLTVREAVTRGAKTGLISGIAEAPEEMTQGVIEDFRRALTFDVDYDMSVPAFVERRGHEALLAIMSGGLVGTTFGVAVELDNRKALDNFMDPVNGMSAVDMALAYNVIPEPEFNIYIEEQFGDQTTEEGVPLQELAKKARQGDRKAAEELVAATTVEASQAAVEAGLTPEESEARGKEAAEVADPIEPLAETAVEEQINLKKQELAALEEAEDSTPEDMKSYEKLDKEIQALETKRVEEIVKGKIMTPFTRGIEAEQKRVEQARLDKEDKDLEQQDQVIDLVNRFIPLSKGTKVKNTPALAAGGPAIIQGWKDAGFSKKEIAAKSKELMTQQGRPNDRLEDQVQKGSQKSTVVDGAIRSVVKLFQGANPFTVVEEFAHAEYDREIAEGTVTVEQVREWRKAVEELTDTPDLRGETDEDIKEWVAEQVKARIYGQRNNLSLPESFLKFLDDIISGFKQILGRAKELQDLEASGQLPTDFLEMLDRQGLVGKPVGTPSTQANAGISEQENIDRVETFQLERKDPALGYTYSYDKDSDKWKQLIKDGYITTDKTLEDFEGKIIFLHQPDGAFSGQLKHGDEVLVEGKGGVFYPIKFHEGGYFWASTENAAIGMAESLNKILEENDGTIYMALTSAPVEKLLSSTTMSNAVMDFFVAKANNSEIKINKSETQDAIIEAANAKTTKKVKDPLTDEVTIKEESLGVDLKKSDSFIENLKKIRAALNPEESNFAARKAFSLGMIARMADIINAPAIAAKEKSAKKVKELRGSLTSPATVKERTQGLAPAEKRILIAEVKAENLRIREAIKEEKKSAEEEIDAVKQMAQFFTEGTANEYFKGKTKTGKLSISAANMKQALSDMLSEPLVKPFQAKENQGGFVYAVLEMSGKVEAVKSKQHESYPMAIKSATGSKTKLHILNDSPHWSSVFEDPTTSEVVNQNPTYVGQNAKGDDVNKNRLLELYPTSGVSIGGMKVNTKSVDPTYSLEVEESMKDVTKRTPEVVEAAAQYGAGKITLDEYNEIVAKADPIKPFTEVPAAATEEEIIGALKKDKVPFVGTENFTRTLSSGDRVGARLDIPAYKDHGVWVASVHEPRSGVSSGGAGAKIGYVPTVRLSNVNFATNPFVAFRIATGQTNKGTIATVEGDWVDQSDGMSEAEAKDVLNDPSWVQVGMNPFRHSYFYDRSSNTGAPVVSAEEVIQVGGLVLAKNPVYAPKNDPRFKIMQGKIKPAALEKAGVSDLDATFSLEQDAAYLLEVESDNMEAAQEMVDEQARMRGYNPLMRLFHGTKKRFDKLKSTRDPNGLIYFSTNEEMAQTYPRGSGGHRTPEADVQARIDNARLKGREYTTPAFEKLYAEYGNDIPMDLSDEVFAKEKEIQRSLLDGMTVSEADMGMGIRVIGGYIKAEDIFEPSNWREFKDVIMESIGVESEADILPQMMDAIESGNYIIWEKKAVVDAVLSKYDAMTIQETSGKPAETIAFRDPSQIKSSDPVTYDADGNVIPLSERFDPTRDEVNYSLEPLSEQDADAEATVAAEERQSRTPERQAFIDYQREIRRTQLDNTEEEKEKLQKLLQLATDADEIAELKQAGDEKIIRVVEQKVKQIRKQAAEREDVTESVKALERLINSPEVPMEVRARMRGYGRLAERKTPQGKARWVEQMANKLEAEIDRHYRTRNVRTLRSLLRPFATEYAPNRRKLRERVGEEARADLNFAQRLLNNSEATPPEGMADERRDELIDIFGDVGNRQSNPTRVSAALEIAGSIAKGGRTSRDDFKGQRRDRNEQVGDLVREEVLNGEEAMGKSQIAAREKQRNVFKKGYDYMRSRLIRGMEGFQQQLNKMDSIKGGILEDLFLPAVYQADQTEKALNREHVERVNEDFKTVLGTDDRQAASWYKNSHELHDTDIEWIEDRAIGMEKRTISKQQGVALFMQWLDPSLRSTFSNMGINEATIEQVKEFIGEIGVSEAYYFRERYAEMGIKLNAKHMEVEGIPLDMIDGYGGRARRINSVGSRQEDMQMFSTNSSGRPTVKSGSMKERTNSTDYLIFQDAAMDFSAHAKEVNHYISHAELAKNLSAAFLNNARARNAITQKHGSDFYDALKAQVEYIIEGNPIVTNKIHRDMDKLRSNVTKAQLMVKPAILVKQLTSAPAFIEEIGPVAYAKAAASLTRNARKFMPMIWGSEYVKNRMSNSQFVDIQQQLDQRDNTLKGLRWDDYAMMNIKWGDIGAVIAGGAPVYVHTYNEAKAAGMTNDQAQAKAEEVFGLASERAQQSSAGHAKGAFLREEGIARTWFMYLTSPLQYQRNVNTSIANLVANVFEKKAGRKSEVKKAANQALRAIVVYHVILPQIFQAVASGLVGFTDDEDYIKEQFWAKQRRALYMGNFNSFPIVGALISKAANLVAETGENFNSSGSPLLDLVQNTTADFHKALKNGDSLDAWLDLGENASLVLGIPAKTVKSYYEAFTDISEGNTENPLLRALGWSKWSLFED